MGCPLDRSIEFKAFRIRMRSHATVRARRRARGGRARTIVASLLRWDALLSDGVLARSGCSGGPRGFGVTSLGFLLGASCKTPNCAEVAEPHDHLPWLLGNRKISLTCNFPINRSLKHGLFLESSPGLLKDQAPLAFSICLVAFALGES